MAIEISPRIKIKASVWTIVTAGALLILLIGFTVAYFYFAFSIKKISQELEEKNIAINPLEKAITEKEAELEPISQKIDDFNKLLAGHKKTLDIFTFLERICLPAIWFSDFDFDSNARKVNLSAQANSFATVEQQLNILKQELALISSNITEISINEEGSISFTLSLILK